MTATFCSQQQKVALVNCLSIIDTYSISSNNQICTTTTTTTSSSVLADAV